MFRRINNKTKIIISCLLIGISLFLTLPIWNGFGCNALFHYENKNFIGYGYYKRGSVEIFLTQRNSKQTVLATHINARIITYKGKNALYFYNLETKNHAISKSNLMTISMLKYNPFYSFKSNDLKDGTLSLIHKKDLETILTINEGRLSFF
ncbi:hypothetical protein [Photobacterium kishitanii]|uniref:Uncharacterized protein n=1 Tax=Photobacterium kishitanii TaxID=318456 RepID=A0A2T3KCG5_9GAMM|nr:hypothetical protein [Photobacterium kishitanii]PSU93429.1 hypothetical protein C9J27_21080 [Photobacterium kishitanii]